jgi:hypothetical protein
MRDRRGTPIGAAVIACALFASALPAFGGSVCDRERDGSAASIASHDARPSEWMAQILGEDYVAVRHASGTAQDAPLPDDASFTSDFSGSTAGPRAAVIPLPTPLWSGMAGLVALTIASAINKIRKML